MTQEQHDVHEYTIEMERKDKFKFLVDFGKESIPNLLMDETEDVPGGENKGPTASMLLASAIGNCLSASLTFCLMKNKIELKNLKTKIIVKRQRNEEGFWRIPEVDVIILPSLDNPDDKKYKRCVDIFKKYCVVTSSVEDGIKVNIDIQEK